VKGKEAMLIDEGCEVRVIGFIEVLLVGTDFAYCIEHYV
jgi:hypothetical protein